jgi:hypothetical protein
VKVIPSCFNFSKMCFYQVSLLLKCSLIYLISSSWGSCTLCTWTEGHIPLRQCGADRLGPVSFYSPFFNKFWIVPRLVCSFCEAMAGTLSVASTAVSLLEVAAVDSAVIGRSAGYDTNNYDLGTLPCGTSALVGKSSVYSVSILQGSICYANRILGQGNNLKRETVLTCTEVQHTVLCRMLQRCLRMLQSSNACFQELHLFFTRFDVSVLMFSVSA